MRLYSFSQSSGLLDLNIILFPFRRSEFCVGGDRIDMSRAVPRRSGTNGVNSKATKGLTPFVEGLSSQFPVFETALACAMSKASIKPGVTTISHSSGCRLSQDPLSDHEKMHATDFADPLDDGGTARYGACEGESEGPSESRSADKAGLGEERLVGRGAPILVKSWSSPTTEIASSSAVESEVTDSASFASEKSLSEDDSEAVDGAYSCLSGDEDRRCFFKNSGVNDGIDTGRRALGFAWVLTKGVDVVADGFFQSPVEDGRGLDSFDGEDVGSSGPCGDG